MDALDRLLRLDDASELTVVLRAGLVGLRASLADALERAPAVPGAPACVHLLQELDAALKAEPAPLRAAPAPVPAPPPVAPGGIVAEFAADAQVRRHLPARAMPTVPSQLPLRLLRLPLPLAARWRQRLPMTAGGGDWQVVPAAEPAVLLPPGPGAPGLREGPDGALDAGVRAAVGDALLRPAVRAAAGAATAVLALAGRDDQLQLALESLQFLGTRRLDTDALTGYRTELFVRLGDLARAAPGTAAEVIALADVDEALASLVHRPPAATASWWAGLRTTVRRALDDAAAEARAGGADVEVRPLALRYRDVQGLTGDNDIPVEEDGEAGEVLACLRVWARVDGRVLPGRVMYRA